MQAQRTGVSTYRLVHGGQEIGYIDGRRVGFTGFATAGDAGHAAWASTEALRLRRRGPSGRMARGHEPNPLLIQRGPDDLILADCDIVAAIVRTPGEAHFGDAEGWGFEIESPMEDGPELFMVSQARVMWNGFRGQRRRTLSASPATMSPGVFS